MLWPSVLVLVLLLKLLLGVARCRKLVACRRRRGLLPRLPVLSSPGLPGAPAALVLALGKSRSWAPPAVLLVAALAEASAGLWVPSLLMVAWSRWSAGPPPAPAAAAVDACRRPDCRRPAVPVAMPVSSDAW
jgi:hypothetical protein